MCLDTVTKRKWFPNNTVVEAYKVLRPMPNGTLMGTHQYDETRERGVWLKAKNSRKRNHNGEPRYRRGFHCFYDVQSAANWAWLHCWASDIIVKVFVRGVRTVGVQGSMSVLVADEMYIPTNAAPIG